MPFPNQDFLLNLVYLILIKSKAASIGRNWARVGHSDKLEVEN